jgi:hypothetical protein
VKVDSGYRRLAKQNDTKQDKLLPPKLQQPQTKPDKRKLSKTNSGKNKLNKGKLVSTKLDKVEAREVKPCEVKSNRISPITLNWANISSADMRDPAQFVAKFYLFWAIGGQRRMTQLAFVPAICQTPNFFCILSEILATLQACSRATIYLAYPIVYPRQAIGPNVTKQLLKIEPLTNYNDQELLASSLALADELRRTIVIKLLPHHKLNPLAGKGLITVEIPAPQADFVAAATQPNFAHSHWQQLAQTVFPYLAGYHDDKLSQGDLQKKRNLNTIIAAHKMLSDELMINNLITNNADALKPDELLISAKTLRCKQASLVELPLLDAELLKLGPVETALATQKSLVAQGQEMAALIANVSQIITITEAASFNESPSNKPLSLSVARLADYQAELSILTLLQELESYFWPKSFQD